MITKLFSQWPWPPATPAYLTTSALANIVWEVAHLPLYTLWQDQSPGQIAFAVVHCSAGDFMIATSVLLLATAVFGRAWPQSAATRFRASLLILVLGLAYTIFSEWMNVEVRGAWQYSGRMPVLPLLGTGLSPLLQWIVVPLLALRAMSRARATAN